MNRIFVLAGVVVLAGCGQGGQTVEPGRSRADEPIAAPTAGSDLRPVSVEGPTCDDREVVEFVVDAFNVAQDLETMSGVSMDALTEVVELGVARESGDDWRQTRACSAKSTLSNGETIDVWFHVKLPRIEDAVGYRVKICTSKYDPINKGDCAAFATPPTP